MATQTQETLTQTTTEVAKQTQAKQINPSTFYKSHRVQITNHLKSITFDIYSGPLFVAAGFVINEFGREEAISRAKQLIDNDFNTSVLAEIRKIPRWA